MPVSGQRRRRNPYGLNDREWMMVREYLKDLNQTQAYIRCGFNGSEPGDAASHAFGKPQIQNAITLELEKRSERTKVEADRVVREIAKQAFANIGHFVEWGYEDQEVLDRDGNPTGTVERKPFMRWKDSCDLSEEDLAAVVEVEFDEERGKLKVKLADKGRALDQLAKHLGLYLKDPGELLELLLAGLDPISSAHIRKALAEQVARQGSLHPPTE